MLKLIPSYLLEHLCFQIYHSLNNYQPLKTKKIKKTLYRQLKHLVPSQRFSKALKLTIVYFIEYFKRSRVLYTGPQNQRETKSKSRINDKSTDQSKKGICELNIESDGFK